MPTPPSELVARMVAAEAPRRQRSNGRAWVLAVCGGLAITTFALVPRTSSAAVTLDRLVDAHHRSDVLYRVTPYWIEGQVRTPKIWTGYVRGNRWRLVQPNFEQASDGSRITTYLPKEDRAIFASASDSPLNARSVLAGADLSWWKSMERKGLKIQHNVEWNGLRVDRYEITTTSKDWGTTTSVLYADPVKARPLYAENLHATGNGNAMKWDYLSPAEESVLRITLRSGTKVEVAPVQDKGTASDTPKKAGIQ